MSRPQSSKTWLKLFNYTLIGGSIVGITIVISINSPKPVEAGFPDDARILTDGDSIPQISKSVKVAITHNSPGMTPAVELIDTSWGAAFYSSAVVKDGYARFELKAGNPQDAGRVFKVRGLLFPAGANIHYGMPYDKPLSGDELFPPMFLHRE